MARNTDQISLNFSDFSEKLTTQLRPPAKPYSVGQAIELLGKIERQEESVEDYRLRLRWCKGFVLDHTDRPFGTGAEIVSTLVKDLWRVHNIRSSKTLLYECQRLYRMFEGDAAKFEAWINQMKRVWNRPVHWRDIQEHILGGRSNPDVIGREAADQRDFLEAEKGVEALEKIMIRVSEGDEEAKGVLEGIRQSLLGLLLLPDGKHITPRNEEYIAFVRTHPCIVCRQPAEAHHAFARGGSGLKASDFTCVPLCRKHHDEFHRRGRETFERAHRVDLVEVAYNLVHRFITGTWATLRLADGKRASA